MAEEVARTGHAAFTWTGPYGSGKSSLVVALSALIGPDGKRREIAANAVGRKLSAHVHRLLQAGPKGWRTVPVVGSRTAAATLIEQALRAEGLLRGSARSSRSSEEVVLSTLERAVSADRRTRLLVVFDELGKVFEHAAETGEGLYFFQQLAELASRCSGRLIFLGVLHQAFDEYAGRLPQEQRNEWAKVQGRFIDIPLHIAGPEQLEILSEAISAQRAPKSHGTTCSVIADILRKYRPAVGGHVLGQLKRCWPLHPVTALLLGPISQRRFGQNQRSVFGFLNSSEPYGFLDFLRTAIADETYGPARLWTYLQANLEPAILASPDGHRWSIAIDAIERCEAKGGSEAHLALAKTIAVIDLLRDRSGLYAREEVLRTVMPHVTNASFRAMLRDLSTWSIIVYRKHLQAFAVFSGSDFDLESALEAERRKIRRVDLPKLRKLLDLRSIVAKRHYHQTGALRWFDVDFTDIDEIEHLVRAFAPSGAMGRFLLVVPTSRQNHDGDRDICKRVSALTPHPIAIGLPRSGALLQELATEFLALDLVSQHNPILAGDSIARREVEARYALTATSLRAEIRNAFDRAKWWVRGGVREIEPMVGLSRIASELADETYAKSPIIPNELLNRMKPSSNAVAARGSLMHAMVAASRAKRLGIDGYPPEGGLYASILEATNLHVPGDEEHQFREPSQNDPTRLMPLWRAADEYTKIHRERMVSAHEIYALWGDPPYGLREGLKPVLFLAYLLTRPGTYTLYRDNIFEPALNGILVDTLIQDPSAVGLRIFDVTSERLRLLEAVRDIATRLSPREGKTQQLTEPIDVAKALVALLQMQPKWVQRTDRLAPNAKVVRDMIAIAQDPNKLLFEDIPEICAKAGDLCASVPHIDMRVELLRSGLMVLSGAYGGMLSELEGLMREELGVSSGEDGLHMIHTRAQRVKGVTGDLRLEAFVTRLLAYDGSPAEFEGIAGLAASKPPRVWTDSDVDRATIELADLAQRFNKAEAYARVKGRPNGRHAVAFVIGLDHNPQLISYEFEIDESDRPTVSKLAREVQEMLERHDTREEVLLSVLAKVGSDLGRAFAAAPNKRKVRR